MKYSRRVFLGSLAAMGLGARGVVGPAPIELKAAAPAVSYYDLLARAGLQACSPLDPYTVMRNVEKQVAVETEWLRLCGLSENRVM